MTVQQQLISDLLKTIDDSVNKFNGAIPAVQSQMLDDVLLLVKDLDVTPDGTIKNSVANLRAVGKIKTKLQNAVLSDEYLNEVKDFAESFAAVAAIQNKYFRSIESDFKPSKLLDEIQKQAIDWTIESLTESGIASNVTNEIEDLLRRNVTSGGSYSDLSKQLRDSIISNKTGNGLLERYVSQTTVDAINQYNRQYSQAVADDLNMNWFWHTGSLITTSRAFCIACEEKKWFHRSELGPLVHGEIFTREKVPINPKTKLWYGAIPGTNASNILINSGGYGCQHIFQPVSSAVVPADIRAKFPD